MPKPAPKPYILEERDGRTVRVYESGTVLDHATGRIAQPPQQHMITVDNTAQMHRARQERKQRVMLAAANEAVERADWRTTHGDMAFVAALADTAMRKATTADDPKAIDAARFLLQESGLSEAKQAQPQQDTSAGVVRDMLASLAQLARDAARMAEARGNSDDPV